MQRRPKLVTVWRDRRDHRAWRCGVVDELGVLDQFTFPSDVTDLATAMRAAIDRLGLDLSADDFQRIGNISGVYARWIDPSYGEYARALGPNFLFAPAC